MRTVFIFFLGLNVLFFAWQSSSFNPATPPSKQSLTAIPANVSKLVLIRETGQGQQSSQSSSKRSTSKQSPSEEIKHPSEDDADAGKKTISVSLPLPPQHRGAGRYECFTLGPFKKAEQATPIALKLRSLGAITNERQHENQEEPGGYWVYLPRFSSWKAARKKVMQLEKRGVRDMFIMGRGNLQNAVSAGLYTSSDAAQKRVAQLKRYGANAKIQIQYNSTPEYWIDIDVEADKKQVISAIDAIAKGLTVLKLRPQKCNDNR